MDYVSNQGGGFQGPQSDYWMYGLGDMSRARDNAAHQQDQVHNMYLQKLAAQKGQNDLDEYNANAQLRQQERTLKELQGQGDIAAQPYKNESSLYSAVQALPKAKQEAYNRDMAFITQHFPELDATMQDPTKSQAQKQHAWGSFMQTMGVGEGNPMRNYSEQGYKVLQKLYTEHQDSAPTNTVGAAREDDKRKEDAAIARRNWEAGQNDLNRKNNLAVANVRTAPALEKAQNPTPTGYTQTQVVNPETGETGVIVRTKTGDIVPGPNGEQVRWNPKGVAPNAPAQAEHKEGKTREQAVTTLRSAIQSRGVDGKVKTIKKMDDEVKASMKILGITDKQLDTLTDAQLQAMIGQPTTSGPKKVVPFSSLKD